jgi:hypothetical protein
MGACGGTITHLRRRIVKVTAEWRVYALGGVLCLALTLCSRHFGDRGGVRFMIWLTLAGIAYLFAIRELFATPKFSKRVVIIGIVLASIWHIVFLRLPPGADDDIHRYVWDARLQRLGYNPYVVVPSDPTVRSLRNEETRGLNNPDLASPYPAGTQLFSRAVTAIHESTFALKVAFVICDFGIALVLLDVLRATGRSAHLVLAYAWNPLLAVEVAGSGHIDIVGALLLLISVAALGRSLGQAARLSCRTESGFTELRSASHTRAACRTKAWCTIAAVTFGLAVAVKFLPIVLLPLYWKRVRVSDAALAAVVVGLLYVPFLNHGRIPIGSLGTYVTAFRFNGPVFALFHTVAPPQLLAMIAVLVGFAAAIYFRKVFPELSSDAFAWPMAATLICAPVVFPWYLLWLVPLLTSPSTQLITIWTVSIIPTYFMWHLSSVRGAWGALPGWIMPLEYGCVATAAAIIALRRRRMKRSEFPIQAKPA